MNFARSATAPMWRRKYCGRTRRGCSALEQTSHVDAHAFQRFERPDIRPPDLASDRRDTRRFLHEGVIDGDVRHGFVILARHGGDFWRYTFELATEHTAPPYEHAGVPGVIARGEKLLRALE